MAKFSLETWVFKKRRKDHLYIDFDYNNTLSLYVYLQTYIPMSNVLIVQIFDDILENPFCDFTTSEAMLS